MDCPESLALLLEICEAMYEVLARGVVRVKKSRVSSDTCSLSASLWFALSMASYISAASMRPNSPILGYVAIDVYFGHLLRYARRIVFTS